MTRYHLRTNNYLFEKITAALLLSLAPFSEIASASQSASGAVYSYSQLDSQSAKLVSSKDLIAQEDARIASTINLIASENYPSQAVREAQASLLTALV